MTTAEERVIQAPALNPENERFFEACKEGKLLVGKCKDCNAFHFYPRTICPHCNSDQIDWVPAKGSGTVYTFSTMRRGVPVPYTIAYVTLDEGVSMMTNIVDCDPDEIKVGDKVKLVFRNAEDGTPLPMFAPA